MQLCINCKHHKIHTFDNKFFGHEVVTEHRCQALARPKTVDVVTGKTVYKDVYWCSPVDGQTRFAIVEEEFPLCSVVRKGRETCAVYEEPDATPNNNQTD